MEFWLNRCRWLVGLATLPLSACIYIPRPVSVMPSTANPHNVSTESKSVAAKKAPAIANRPVETPAFALVGHSSSSPVPLPKPQTYPAPYVQLQTVEPFDEPPISPLQPVESPRPVPPPALESREPPNPMMVLATRLCDGSLLQSDPQDIAAAVEQLNTLMAPLRARAALEIPKLCFCRPIAAPARFGTFEKLDENHRFRPGETVGVYMELRNFSSTPQGGNYAVCVQSTIEIHDSQGQVVFRFDADRTDSSLSPRQDYCNVSRFTLPALPSGAYTLWLKTTDTPTGRSARRSLDFRVASTK
jgi:hypothetical protein